MARSKQSDAELLGVQIAELECVDGAWRAVLRFRGEHFRVDRSVGSWRITPGEGERDFQHVTPSLAAELQRRVMRLERKGARAN